MNSLISTMKMILSMTIAQIEVLNEWWGNKQVDVNQLKL